MGHGKNKTSLESSYVLNAALLNMSQDVGFIQALFSRKFVQPSHLSNVFIDIFNTGKVTIKITGICLGSIIFAVSCEVKFVKYAF